MRRIWIAVAVGLMVTVAGVAVADNLASSKQADFFSPGNHKFYVWCGSGANFTAIERGQSAEDAQMRLYNDVKSKGSAACWPVWQGKVAS